MDGVWGGKDSSESINYLPGLVHSSVLAHPYDFMHARPPCRLRTCMPRSHTLMHVNECR